MDRKDILSFTGKGINLFLGFFLSLALFFVSGLLLYFLLAVTLLGQQQRFLVSAVLSFLPLFLLYFRFRSKRFFSYGVIFAISVSLFVIVVSLLS